MVPCSTAATVTLENSAINYSVMYCYYYSRPFMQAKRNSQLGHSVERERHEKTGMISDLK